MTAESGPIWDFDSGKLPFDFINTLEWRQSDEPVELLKRYPDLVEWATAAGLVEFDDGVALQKRAASRSKEPQAVLDEARALRESLYSIFSAAARSEMMPDADLQRLNGILQRTSQNAVLERGSNGLNWAWGHDSLDWMLGPIAREAAELLTSAELAQVGVCEDTRGCAYVFFDTSRNRSRRWCSMESCGNRAKARRHYQRRIEPVSDPH